MQRVFILLLVFAVIASGQVSIKGTGTITLEGTWTIRQGVGSPLPTLNVTTTSLPSGEEQSAYSQALAATGGDGSYTWVLAPGSNPLPSGLTLATNGTISGTPTAAGTYPFTVCVSDGQVAGEACDEPDIWDDQLLSITIDAAPPAGGLIISSDGGDVTDDMSVWSAAGDCEVQSPLLEVNQIDGAKTIVKTGPDDCVLFAGRSDAEGFLSFDIKRLADNLPASNRDQVVLLLGPNATVTDCSNASPIVVTTSAAHSLETGDRVTITGVTGNTACNVTDHSITKVDADEFSLDSTTGSGTYSAGGTVQAPVASVRVESDWDMFVWSPGMTTFPTATTPPNPAISKARGFIIATPAAGEIRNLRVRYKNTGELDLSVNGGTFQGFTGGTSTRNIVSVVIRDDNDSAGTATFNFDRFVYRTDTHESYTPPVPAGDAAQNCLNQSCVISHTVPSGSDRAVYVGCAAEGADRDAASVTGSVDGALTQIGEHDANSVLVTLWAKLAPTVGDQDFTVAFPGGSDDVRASCGAITLTGISSITAQATATDSDTGTAISTNITTTTDDAVIVSVVGGSDNGSVTPGASQIEFFDAPGPSAGMFGAGSRRVDIGTAGSKTLTYTVSGTMNSTHFAAAFPIVVAIPGTLLSSYGTVCTGSGDDGPEIEAAFADRSNWTNNTLIFPAASICQVNEKLTGLGGKTGFTIEGNGSTIKAANGLTIEDATALVHVVNSSNFIINNLTIDGNRANRSVRETAGGDNLRLLDVQDSTFTNLVSKNGCNDSARVAASNRAVLSTYPENLTFIDSKFDNGYRNSMSVIEGWNIKFIGTCTGTFTGTCTCQFTNANGVSPEAGLDIEPNPNGDPSYPFTEDIEVDGCQFSGNRRRGYLNVTQWDADDSSNARDRNHTVRNSIFKNNGNATANNSDGHMSIAVAGTLVENNYFDAPLSIRFGVIYVTGGKSTASPLNAARNIQIINNFFDGDPPTGWGTAGTPGRFIHWGNIFPIGSAYATGANANTGEYKNNTHTNTTHTTTSDWCSAGAAGNESSGGMSGNILPNGTVSGCP